VCCSSDLSDDLISWQENYRQKEAAHNDISWLNFQQMKGIMQFFLNHAMESKIRCGAVITIKT
jgi:hypothetical protein